jgi:REP element-mobilizing transposase RayT
MTNHDWDDNISPIAYLITFRTYGTWLHGDDRSSIDLHGQNTYGMPKIAPNKNLVKIMSDNRLDDAFILNGQQRRVVEQAIRNVCEHRGYGLMAVHIRTNHAHSVVASRREPELILNAFKSNATRELRVAGLVSVTQRIWSRGGSTRYLWKPRHVDGAVDYVLHGQGDDLPNF